MSANRTFTLNLKQHNTNKTIQLLVTQKGFVPEYVFELMCDPSNDDIYSCDRNSHTQIRNYELDVPTQSECWMIPIRSYRTTVTGKKVPVLCMLRSDSSYPIESHYEPKHNHETEGYLQLEFDENTSYESRSFNLVIEQEDSGKTIQIRAIQPGKPDDGVFTANPTELAYPFDGGTKSSTIVSTSKGKDVSWSVMDRSDLPSWIDVSEDGHSPLNVTVKKNE